MNRFKSLLAISFASTFLNVAHAQSSVTMYGLIDYGLDYASNVQTIGRNGVRTGKSQFAMASSVMQGERLGLLGTENLGGGYNAIFRLESGFDLGTGKLQQGGTYFGRQAYVGLSGPFGQFTMGRQYDSEDEFLDPFGGGVAGGAFAFHAEDMDNEAIANRLNNSVKYNSPNFKGFTLGLTYGFGGVPGSITQNSSYAMAAKYANGPLTVAAGYLHVRNPNQSFWGNTQSGSVTGNNLGPVSGVQQNPIFGGYASASVYQVADAVVQYKADRLTLGFSYSHVGFLGLNNPESGALSSTNPLGWTGNATFNSYAPYAKYMLNPALAFSASYDYVEGGRVNGKSAATYHLANLCLDYFLSKRTDVYLMGAYEIASGVDSTGQSAVASILIVTPSDSGHQAVARVGIRHLF
jgi:predicted porin